MFVVTGREPGAVNGGIEKVESLSSTIERVSLLFSTRTVLWGSFKPLTRLGDALSIIVMVIMVLFSFFKSPDNGFVEADFGSETLWR
jgi:hypothetical protein